MLRKLVLGKALGFVVRCEEYWANLWADRNINGSEELSLSMTLVV